MQRFAALFDEIDSTTATNAKVAAMARYFAEAPPATRRAVTSTTLMYRQIRWVKSLASVRIKPEH